MNDDCWPGKKHQHTLTPRGGGGGRVNVEIPADATPDRLPIHHLGGSTSSMSDGEHSAQAGTDDKAGDL